MALFVYVYMRLILQKSSFDGNERMLRPAEQYGIFSFSLFQCKKKHYFHRKNSFSRQREVFSEGNVGPCINFRIVKMMHRIIAAH